ncbi:MAG TPA: ABC transporter ATP-binding protein [Syntrophales bacterium]|nr:ABC transporter ATP-binding protein [Syntrophales bacterium]
MTGNGGTSNPVIELLDIHKSFGKQNVLNGLSLQVERGRTTVIIGRSGGGKSVVLKHMIGLLKPDSGQVLVDGTDITAINDRELNEVRKKFGMLFQEAALFDSMNVAENVAFPLREHTKKKDREILEIVRETLHSVGLPDVEYKMPSELSGGMRKRVGLARALAMRPEIILFDEPTTGLDPVMTEAINGLIVKTQKDYDLTCVVISHDIQSIFEIGHRIAMLYDGRIIACGEPDEIRNSRDPVLVQFLSGSMEGPISVL